MLFTLIFAVLAVVLVFGVESIPAARANPMLRVGGWFLGAALGLVALAILFSVL